MNWRCRLFGHRWRTVWSGTRTNGAPILICLRCRENGWLLP